MENFSVEYDETETGFWSAEEFILCEKQKVLKPLSKIMKAHFVR